MPSATQIFTDFQNVAYYKMNHKDEPDSKKSAKICVAVGICVIGVPIKYPQNSPQKPLKLRID